MCPPFQVAQNTLRVDFQPEMPSDSRVSTWPSALMAIQEREPKRPWRPLRGALRPWWSATSSSWDESVEQTQGQGQGTVAIFLLASWHLSERKEIHLFFPELLKLREACMYSFFFLFPVTLSPPTVTPKRQPDHVL